MTNFPSAAANSALAQRVLALADDELILGHRNSEWAGHAPILEEDIAFANIALDELGHAQLWFELYHELTNIEPDRAVFFRDAAQFRCIQLVELPRGDWAFTMLRQYLFDVAEMVGLPFLAQSSNGRIAEIAGKLRPEEMYHFRHTSNWVKRLGMGTDESHRRMQTALDELWAYALQIFVPLPGDIELVGAGILPISRDVQAEWEEQVTNHLTSAGLVVPAARTPAATSRAEHTPYITDLVSELQQVARTESFGVQW